MFYKKNIDYVYLLWEDFLFQIENKEAKKTNKMSYPRFTKIIIDYFMSNDQSISRRNKMFWHTTRDDTMFTCMRCISRHEKTQVYGTILPKELTNQAMLESKAYQTYYAYASGEKTPKPKYIRKKANSDTSPKKKPAQATNMPKTKGLAVLSEVALIEAKQLKLATERSKTQFHSSHASGSGDGVDTRSKVPDEKQQMMMMLKKIDDQEEEEEKADDVEVSFDQRVNTPPDYQLTNEEEHHEGDNKVKKCEEEQEE
ncbi:hypothetical protein Tco_0661288 [Tanacetum coccineum]